MGLFVDENDTFPVVLYHRDIRDEEGNLLNVEVSEEEKEGWEKLEVRFCQPSAGVFSQILEDATVLNDLSQKPSVRTRILRDYTLLYCMKEWNKSEEGTAIPICEETIANTHFHIANKLFLEYIKTTKLHAVLQAIIKDETESDNLLRRFARNE